MTTTNRNFIAGLVALVLVTALSVLGIRVHRSQQDAASRGAGKGNPYAYELDEFKRAMAGQATYGETATIPIDGTRLAALAVDAQDRIYVAVDRRIMVLSPDGKPVTAFALDDDPRCLAVAGNGDILVGMADRVVAYSNAGQLIRAWGSMGDRSLFTSIAVAGDRAAVADYGNKLVWLFALDGSLIRMLAKADAGQGYDGLVLPSPYCDVAFDAGGSVWVANTGEQRLERWSVEGKKEQSWGKAAMDTTGFSGCCNPSHFSIMADGSFVTAEKGLIRVKQHGADGAFKALLLGPDQFDDEATGLDIACDSLGRVILLDPGRGQLRVFSKRLEGAL